MPVTNNIKGLLALRRLYGTDCLKVMVDCKSEGAFSYIAQGRVMPTPEDFAIMCRMLKCKPEELYDLKSFDLTAKIKSSTPRPRDAGRENEKEDKTASIPAADNDEATDRLRFWLKRKEKRAFMGVIARLGYKGYSDWHRAAMRAAFERDRQLQLGCSALFDVNYSLDGNDPRNFRQEADDANSHS